MLITSERNRIVSFLLSWSGCLNCRLGVDTYSAVHCVINPLTHERKYFLCASVTMPWEIGSPRKAVINRGLVRCRCSPETCITCPRPHRGRPCKDPYAVERIIRKCAFACIWCNIFIIRLRRACILVITGRGYLVLISLYSPCMPSWRKRWYAVLN